MIARGEAAGARAGRAREGRRGAGRNAVVAAAARFRQAAAVRLRVLYHGNCFDGATSAGLFSRFFRERVEPRADIAYAAMEHKGDGPPIPASLLDGDVNACVDFRYTSDPRLTWWFDHHVSAFPTPADEEHFRADRSGKKFFEPAAKSCSRFLARTCAEKFGFEIGRLRELIDWAETIDGALFPHPAMPVELREPALRLMTWVENNRDAGAAERFLRDLVTRPLAAIAADEYVAGALAPVLARHERNVRLVKERARRDGGVVFVDLMDEDVGALNKFIVYYHHPDARYAVVLLRAPSRLKISVGANPWSPAPRTHDIAKLCERYGGGGHPVVGAISVPHADADGARRIAAEVVAALQQAATP